MLRHIQICRGGSYSHWLQPTQYLSHALSKVCWGSSCTHHLQDGQKDITEWNDIHWSSVSFKRDIFYLTPPELEKFMSTVQHLCMEAGEAAPPLPVLSRSLWQCGHWPYNHHTRSSGTGSGMCACETHMESLPTRLLLTCLQLHVEASSVLWFLISLLLGRNYHEWLMQRGVISSLPGLFASAEHALVFCLVFSVSLCGGSLRRQIFPLRENLHCWCTDPSAVPQKVSACFIASVVADIYHHLPRATVYDFFTPISINSDIGILHWSKTTIWLLIY